MALVERHLENGQQVVVLRYAAFFYWLVWPAMLVTFIGTLAPSIYTTVATIIAWALVLLVAVPYWPITLELKRRMRSAPITASGSRYSLSNPLTYRFEMSPPGSSDRASA